MKIRCRYDKLLSTTDLLKVRNPINPNKHEQSQLKQLADIMLYQGIRHPIVISNLSGLMTKGHGRLQSAIMNGWEEYPVEYQDYDDADMEYYDLVADNAIAMQAEIDLAAVNLQVPNLGPGADLRMLGLKDFEIEPADKLSEEAARAKLSDRFLVPPFTVLNAREGWWQNRKRAWVTLGIQSEIGRAGQQVASFKGQERLEQFRQTKKT